MQYASMCGSPKLTLQRTIGAPLNERPTAQARDPAVVEVLRVQVRRVISCFATAAASPRRGRRAPPPQPASTRTERTRRRSPASRRQHHLRRLARVEQPVRLGGVRERHAVGDDARSGRARLRRARRAAARRPRSGRRSRSGASARARTSARCRAGSRARSARRRPRRRRGRVRASATRRAPPGDPAASITTSAPSPPVASATASPRALRLDGLGTETPGELAPRLDTVDGEQRARDADRAQHRHQPDGPAARRRRPCRPAETPPRTTAP